MTHPTSVIPPGVRDRVLAAASRARPPGPPLPELPAISAAEAFSRAADAFFGMLTTLHPADWRQPVLRDLDVQGLVGHLIGVEDDVQSCLSGDPAVADLDHVEATRAVALQQRGRPPRQTRDAWRRAVDRSLELAAAVAPDRPVAIHGMRLPADALLVVRAFELWVHENDIRRATGLPSSVPDLATLRLMTQLAVRMLPAAVAGAGHTVRPLRLRLVLTGGGGGSWDVEVGDPPPGPAPTTIVVDAVAFCRLVANRGTPDDLDVHVTGERARVAEVLTAAASLALD